MISLFIFPLEKFSIENPLTLTLTKFEFNFFLQKFILTKHKISVVTNVNKKSTYEHKIGMCPNPVNDKRKEMGYFRSC